MNYATDAYNKLVELGHDPDKLNPYTVVVTDITDAEAEQYYEDDDHANVLSKFEWIELKNGGYILVALT